MLVILAVLSIAVGNIAAIAQTNLKRMLAYSTISHMGFMLLGLLSGVVGGNWLSAADAYSAAMFYVIVYVLMTLGAFGMILLLSRAGFEAENLEDFKGLNQRSPWFAFVMLLLMFSLAGVPPTVGFYAKLSVLPAAVHGGLHLARRGRGAVLADRRVLLPAHRQAHVLRRAGGRHRAGAARSPACACCSRSTASRCSRSASCRSR